jgi:Zn-dependent metalloprotease
MTIRSSEGGIPSRGTCGTTIAPAETRAGVHVNSGIPNHAFYVFARHLGGHAWTSAGRVWYDALRSGLDARCDFREFAEATLAAAEHHGEHVVAALAHAWHLVGVRERAAA